MIKDLQNLHFVERKNFITHALGLTGCRVSLLVAYGPSEEEKWVGSVKRFKKLRSALEQKHSSD